MRPKNFKGGRCIKNKIKKCEEVARTYDKIQTAYADVLDKDKNIEVIKCNVLLENLEDGEFTRIFPITKSYLHHEMRRGCEASGVKKIRIHDIRHSHVSLLIDMGFSAVAIANRVGHESIDITYRYAHLFPTRQGDMADKLNTVRCKYVC